MSEVLSLNHIALVVEDIDLALHFWQDGLGLKLERIIQVPKEDSIVAFLPVGNSEIELVQPTSKESGLAKYLTKRGPGMHHLCIQVKDILKIMDKLVGMGVQMIHEKPIKSENGSWYTFIHPKSAYGVLVELYEIPHDRSGKFPTLETKRLIMREFSEMDVQAVFEMFRRQDMNQFLEVEPMQLIEEAEIRVQNRINLFDKGWGCRWAITLKEAPHQVIGSCGYFGVRVSTHTVEIGFEVHPDLWKKGIMTEALTAILDYSFSENAFRPVNRIEALVDPENERSLGLLQKLGFVDEGTRRKFGFWKGKYHDVKLLALLRDDWKPL